MRLTVLGCSGSFPAPGGACSGYLVEDERTKILLDCGPGVMGRLQKYTSFETLDAILLTHLHFDHLSDLFVLRYAIETRRDNGETIREPSIYIPDSPGEIAVLIKDGGFSDIHLLKDGFQVSIGDMKVSFYKMVHTVETYAVRIENTKSCLTYSGDTVMNDRLLEAATHSDLFLCEATRPEDHPGDGFAIPHMTARQAGKIAAGAGVKNLLLTHFWYQQDLNTLLKQAHEEFPNAALAQEFTTVTF